MMILSHQLSILSHQLTILGHQVMILSHQMTIHSPALPAFFTDESHCVAGRGIKSFYSRAVFDGCRGHSTVAVRGSGEGWASAFLNRASDRSFENVQFVMHAGRRGTRKAPPRVAGGRPHVRRQRRHLKGLVVLYHLPVDLSGVRRYIWTDLSE